MHPDLHKSLTAEEPDEFHQQMLSHCRNLVDMSRKAMSSHYDTWDRYDEIYRGIRLRDETDKKASERGEPEKVVVPVSFAQIQTFVSFCFMLFTQREYFFELLTNKPEAYDASQKAEALLQRDLNRCKFNSVLYQFLLDVARFGVAINKIVWVEETKKSQVKAQPSMMGSLVSSVGYFFGQTMQPQTPQYEEVPTFQGNKITSISPYRFFPDTRLPLKRFQEGEFVAMEDEQSYQHLRKLEGDGVVAGIKWVKQPNKISCADRDWRRYPNMTQPGDAASQPATSVGGTVIITEVQVNIIPSDFKINGKALGTEKVPVKYLVWYANDSRVIRCEPLNYPHGDFTYTLAEYSPDQNHFLNAGLSETIDKLQDVISFLINSHITSVRKVIQNQLVVDPEGVEMDDIRNRRPVIRLKPGKSSTGVDRYIKQLQVHDVTGNHMVDAETIQQLVQLTTGINDNALGQFNQGRRSATEARNVSAGTTGRLKTNASLLWTDGLEPMGRQMIQNLQAGLTADAYVKVFGTSSDPNVVKQLMKVTPQDIEGEYDFDVFDGTLASDKTFIAQALEEVLGILLQNPEAIALTNLDPKAMLYEAMRLRGVKTPERFELPPQPVLPGVVPGGATGGQPGVPQTPLTNGQPANTGVGISQLLANGSGTPSGGV